MPQFCSWVWCPLISESAPFHRGWSPSLGRCRNCLAVCHTSVPVYLAEWLLSVMFSLVHKWLLPACGQFYLWVFVLFLLAVLGVAQGLAQAVCLGDLVLILHTTMSSFWNLTFVSLSLMCGNTVDGEGYLMAVLVMWTFVWKEQGCWFWEHVCTQSWGFANNLGFPSAVCTLL